MSDLAKILSTETGIKTIRNKIGSLSAEERAKPGYQNLLKQIDFAEKRLAGRQRNHRPNKPVAITNFKNPKQILEFLCSKYFRMFNLNNRRKPLSTTMLDEILDIHPEFDKDTVSSALRFYTNHLGYHRSVMKSKQRFNLFGKPCEEMKYGHRAHSRKILEKAETEAEAEEANI